MATEIRLKILSGGNAILADCLGYESEVFVPVIVDNRITIQNITLSKKCSKQNAIKNIRNPLVQLNRINVNTIKKLYLPEKSPLAKSTPGKIRIPKENLLPSPITMHSELEFVMPSQLHKRSSTETYQERISNKISKVAPMATVSPRQLFPSPDIVRRAVKQNKEESICVPGFRPRAGLKIVRLHRVNTPNTPNKAARIIIPTSRSVYTSATKYQNLRNISNVSSFGNAPSLQVSPASGVIPSPSQSFLLKSVNGQSSAKKWRKCITPQRTYLRRSAKKTPLQIRRLTLKRLEAKNNRVSEFRMNPSVIVKPRKLVVDNRVVISPKSFKKQLKTAEDLKRNAFELPKTRRSFHVFHMTAFDLLTNSGFYPKMGVKLNLLFRKGCLNKHADTIHKYQPLTKDLPQLETKN